MLDGDDEIILGNWLNKKSLESTSNNDTCFKIPDYSYVLGNRSNLCNCELEAYSLAAGLNSHTQFKGYFAVNLAFFNY